MILENRRKQITDISHLFWRTYMCTLFGGHWYPCFGFLVTFPLGFKARVGYTLFTFMEANVFYIPWDPSLNLHLPTSWKSAWWPIASPHPYAEVGIGNFRWIIWYFQLWSRERVDSRNLTLDLNFREVEDQNDCLPNRYTYFYTT